ncbi:hypothetical protein GCM10023091_13820 [Ravibacter arvi]|uniref:Glycosyltransferase 2-like domain-containing protein n=1 Tax=Ravibacter arvi TaxID=2051041 RepID=A0ABP8LT50_9BACT
MRADTDPTAISVVIPVYRSAATLTELHTRLGAVLNEIGAGEIIYVNDASPDQSLALLRQLPPVIPFRILSLNTNKGQSTALLCGIKAASCPLVATMDADLQDSPELLPALLGGLSTGIDVVFAARSGTYESPARHLSSFLFKSVVFLFSAGRIPRQAGLYLVMRKQSCSAFADFLPHRPYLMGLIARFRLKTGSVPFIRTRNPENETSYTFKKRLQVAKAFFRTLFLPVETTAADIEKWWNSEITEYTPLHKTPENNP